MDAQGITTATDQTCIRGLHSNHLYNRRAGHHHSLGLPTRNPDAPKINYHTWIWRAAPRGPLLPANITCLAAASSNAPGMEA